LSWVTENVASRICIDAAKHLFSRPQGYYQKTVEYLAHEYKPKMIIADCLYRWLLAVGEEYGVTTKHTENKDNNNE
jgi:hypothetical protein